MNVQRHGKDAVATLFFHSGAMATMYCVHSAKVGFHWSYRGTTGSVTQDHKNDASAYLEGVRLFLKMFRTRKEPIPRSRLLAPVAVLRAMAKSLQRGKPVNVAKVGI